jgi:hypothetical protein
MIRNYVRTIRFAFPAVANIVTSTTIHQICMPTSENAVLASGKSDAYKIFQVRVHKSRESGCSGD